MAHRPRADQLSSLYAQGRDLRRVIGESSLMEVDRRMLAFADSFERRFVHQSERRSLFDTLDLAWQLLDDFPEDDLKRIPSKMLEERRLER